MYRVDVWPEATGDSSFKIGSGPLGDLKDQHNLVSMSLVCCDWGDCGIDMYHVSSNN